MRFFSLIAITLSSFLASSCTFFPEGPVPPPTGPVINSAEMTSIIQDFAAEWKHDPRHINLEHANTYFDGGIHAIQLQFISQGIIEMCEARELIVDMVEGLLAKLNQNPLVACQFYDFPFAAGRLEIYITFESYFGKFVDPRYIAWICLEDGAVTFYTFEVLDNDKMCWHSRRETYPTSREIVVYEREAEKKYQEIHHPPFDVFGASRYVPPPPP